jgi:putative DNA primase/helicase
MKESFYGREDHGLGACLLAELPGILNWSLEGRDRLMQRGYFVPPASSLEVMQELEDLGSPIKAFLRDECELGASQKVEINTLYVKYTSWCTGHGYRWPATAQAFGRDLRAAVPEVNVIQPREAGSRLRYYQGIGIKPRDPARDGTRPSGF